MSGFVRHLNKSCALPTYKMEVCGRVQLKGKHNRESSQTDRFNTKLQEIEQKRKKGGEVERERERERQTDRQTDREVHGK